MDRPPYIWNMRDAMTVIAECSDIRWQVWKRPPNFRGKPYTAAPMTLRDSNDTQVRPTLSTPEFQSMAERVSDHQRDSRGRSFMSLSRKRGSEDPGDLELAGREFLGMVFFNGVEKRG